MTAPKLATAAHAVDRRRRRSRQRKLGPSSVGKCRRQAGYKLHGVKPTDDDSNRMAAILGTWLHRGALDALRREAAALVEVALEDDRLRGSADLVYLDPATAGPLGLPAGDDVCTVEDVKTRSTYTMDRARTYGPRPAEVWQVHLYADLLRRGRAKRKPLQGVEVPVERVRLRFLDRNDGSEHVWEQPYDPQVTADALWWLDEVERSGSPDELPRDEAGPGLSVVCDSCPFLTACWGPERPDGRPRQVLLVRDDEDAARYARELLDARQRKAAATDDEKAARAALAGTPDGLYGAVELVNTPVKGRTSVDLDAVREVWQAAGLGELPEKVGKPSARLDVRLVKADRSA